MRHNKQRITLGSTNEERREREEKRRRNVSKKRKGRKEEKASGIASGLQEATKRFEQEKFHWSKNRIVSFVTLQKL